MRAPEPVTLTPAAPLRAGMPFNDRWTLLRACIASPLLLMTGPGSSGGGPCCGSTELRTPPFQISRIVATATPRVMRRPIHEATAAADLPCREKRGPPEGGGVVGSEEGGGNQGRRRA